ncbi:MAG: Uma2 family endonuclease [Spirosomataceae bacterium]
MTTATQIVLNEEQKAAIEAGKPLIISASWEEFMEFLPTTSYKAEFVNNEIIIMGLAKFLHEWLVIRIGFILSNFYQGQLNVFVLGSNLGVARPEKSYFNPDVTVVKGMPDFYRDSESIIKNPYLVIEVLSTGTANYDWETKLPRYQRIDTMQEIVMIDPFEKIITVISRTAEAKVWTMTIYDQPTDTIVLDGNTLPLSSFFEGMPLIP